MNVAKAPEKILEAMKEHELALAELYAVYADKFPEYKDFWTEFSREEIQHADYIKTLQTIAEKSSEDFVVERFAVETVERSTEYVKGQVNKASQSDILLINALSTALYLEQALIEKKYFEVFQSDNPQTKQILSLLEQETRRHYERLYTVLKELRVQ